MGVERIGRVEVGRREKPHFAQPRDRAPPFGIAEANERVGQAGYGGRVA